MAETASPGELARIFEAHRPLLRSVAYRMLGSVSQAEDAVQEAWLRFAAHGGAVEEPRAWLITVITRLCLDDLKSARARRETYVGPWLPEPVVMEPQAADAVELAESLSMAFLLLLETLSPLERAAFLLREVFDHDYAEVARILGRSEASCRQLIRRARGHIDQGRPRFPAPPGAGEEVVAPFMSAVAAGDLEAATALLAEDVQLISDGGGKVSAARRPVLGADRVARFMIGVARRAAPSVTVSMEAINGMPGLVAWDGAAPVTVFIFQAEGGRLARIYAVNNPDKLAHLRRPAQGEADREQ